jgi:hypothetical protein
VIETALQQAKVAELLGARPVTQYGVLLESSVRRTAVVVDTYNRASFVTEACRNALRRGSVTVKLPRRAEDLCHGYGDVWSWGPTATARLTILRLYAIAGQPPPPGAALALLTLTLRCPQVPILIKASDGPKILIANPKFQATMDVVDWREPRSAVVVGVRNPGELEHLAGLDIVHFAESLGRRGSDIDSQQAAG